MDKLGSKFDVWEKKIQNSKARHKEMPFKVSFFSVEIMEEKSSHKGSTSKIRVFEEVICKCYEEMFMNLLSTYSLYVT